MNKLYFISPALSRFLYADCDSHNLNIINMGVPVFLRNKSKFSSNSECIFRISQDGLLNLIPYMTKRLIYAPDLDSFKYFLMHKDIETSSVPGAKLRSEIENFSTGCFVLALQTAPTLVEGIVMHKFTKAVNMMVSRENIFSLRLRYLSQAERESVAGMFDLA